MNTVFTQLTGREAVLHLLPLKGLCVFRGTLNPLQLLHPVSLNRAGCFHDAGSIFFTSHQLNVTFKSCIFRSLALLYDKQRVCMFMYYITETQGVAAELEKARKKNR